MGVLTRHSEKLGSSAQTGSYLILVYASRVFIREREEEPVYPSIIIRVRAHVYAAYTRGRGFAGSSNGVKNSRPLKQKAGGEVTAWIFLPTVKDPHSSVWWPLLNARMQWLGYQPRLYMRFREKLCFSFYLTYHAERSGRKRVQNYRLWQICIVVVS